MRIDEPLHLAPILVPKPWGGRRLARLGRCLPEDVPIGESWEVADLASAAASDLARSSTSVRDGRFAGRELSELIAEDRDSLLGDAADLDGRFPLLVKLLDVRTPLSVQVHPLPVYARDHLDVAAKTETWVVLEADPGAEVMIGLVDGVTPAQVRAAAGTPQIVPLLRHLPARRGDVLHVPPGTVHAIGAGVLLAEVQTPSDTTFRLYDWTQEQDRPPRRLHLERGLAALAVADTASSAPAGPARLPLDAGAYRLDRCHLDAAAAKRIVPGTLRVLIVMGGRLAGDGFAEVVGPGGTVVLPAAWGGALRAERGAASWLEVTLGDRSAP